MDLISMPSLRIHSISIQYELYYHFHYKAYIFLVCQNFQFELNCNTEFFFNIIHNRNTYAFRWE